MTNDGNVLHGLPHDLGGGPTMAEKDDKKRSTAVNPMPDDDSEGDLQPVRPATLGAPTRTRRQLEEEVAEFRRNLRRRGDRD